MKTLKIITINMILLCACPIRAATPIILQNWQQIPFVNVSDPQVISAANFATKQMKRGSLYKIVFAQKQINRDSITYVLTLEIVDAHIKHHRYSAQVLIPNDGTDWDLVYFTPVQY